VSEGKSRMRGIPRSFRRRRRRRRRRRARSKPLIRAVSAAGLQRRSPTTSLS